VNVDEWNRVAPAWERHRERTQSAANAVSERMLALLDPEPSWTVLEVAAGPGDTGFLAARVVERLISSDFAGAMVDAARRRAAEIGLENVEFRVLDAGRLELEDDSVDGILCRWAYMLVDDPPGALAEARRVLRPGGRLSFAVWGEARRNPWASTLGRILLERGRVEAPEPGAPGMFALAEPERISTIVRGAGFEEPAIEEVPLEYRFEDVDEFLGVQLDLAAQTGALMRSLPPTEFETVRAELARRFEQFRDGDELVVPGVSVVVAAS
jgi:SAM-dependent methyltransferase